MNRPAWRAARSWAPLALAALSLAGVPSCGRRVAAREDVVFWVSWPASAIASLARRFEEENPGLHVVLVQIPWGSGADSAAAAQRAGAPPDLCQLHAAQVPPFLEANSLSDWSAGVADLRAGIRGWGMCTLGDAIYGLPWLLRTQVLYFDRSLFARAGLDSARAPATWDEAAAAAAKLQRLHGGVHGFGLLADSLAEPLGRLMPFGYGLPRDSVTAGSAAPGFDPRLDAALLERLQSLRSAGLVASGDSLAHEFLSGRLGMLLAGSELAARIAREAPGLRYGTALVPGEAGGSGTSVAAGEVLASFTGSRRKEDALRLARFLARPENTHGLATALGIVQPSTLGADTTAWYRARPEQLLMFRQLETARFVPNFRGRRALADTLRSLVDATLAGRLTPGRAAALADSFVTRRLRRG